MGTQVFQNIGQCLTLTGVRGKKGRNPTEADLGIISQAAVVVQSGIVAWVGPQTELPQKYATLPHIDADNHVWLPALVECHTHLIYGGSRVADYGLRCQGVSYQEIALAGGGILSTVQATREASKEELLDRAKAELQEFSSFGVQCLEIKSGYGLTLESEIKILECIQALQKETSIRLVPTFLPAHAFPPEFRENPDAYVDAICQEWIPEIARRKLAKFFDVFIEEGYFSVDQAKRMIETAQAHDLLVKLHVDQFTDKNGAQLAVLVRATSCDHLEHISSKNIKRIASSHTVAVLAPGASLFTGTPFPPARKLIDAGAIVALTTDFNPGTCPSHNLPLMMTIACSQMKMTIPEAIAACTYNAALALNEEDRFGTIEVGRPFEVWQVPATSYEAIPYLFGEV